MKVDFGVVGFYLDHAWLYSVVLIAKNTNDGVVGYQ